MTTPPTPPLSPAPPPEPSRWPWLIPAAAVALVLIGLLIAAAVSVRPSTTAAAPAETGAERATRLQEMEAWYARFGTPARQSPAVVSPLPSPADFVISIKILRKQCFGSAGCNVTYQIDPQYTGATPLKGRTLMVVYEVAGGEDSPQINNFTVRGDGSASFPKEERTGTSSSGATLKAKVTSISED